MNNKIQVITKIPNCDIDDGNLYDEVLVADIDKCNNIPCYRPINDINAIENRRSFKLPVKQEVFSLGEIIIIDENEREVGGRRRKASKWYVEYRLFLIEDLEEAIKLSKNVKSS